MKKKNYISANMNVVTLSTNVIATSNYGLNSGTDDLNDGAANDGGNSFAPTRHNNREYDLYE